jgi:hypothetical protein
MLTKYPAEFNVWCGIQFAIVPAPEGAARNRTKAACAA